MKKIIVGLLLVGFANTTMAQIRRTPSTNLNPNADTTQKISKKEMMDQLGLTKDQRVQWKQIHQNERTQRDAIMANDSLNAEQKKQQLKSLRKDTNQNINAILTDEQRQKLQALKQEMKDDRMNNQPNTQGNSANNNAPVVQ
jgi:Spy/CpxP family protein refolding chaperone